MNNLETQKSKTNWKYLLVVIILAFIIGGGILGYQYWWLPQKEIELPEIKKEIKPAIEKLVEVPLEELKEGENKIGNIIIEKIKQKVLCDLGTIELGAKFEEFMEGLKIKVGELEIKKLEEFSGEELSAEVTCNIENKAKVKMWSSGWEKEYSSKVVVMSFFVLDKNNNIVDKRGGGEEYIEFREEASKVKIFHYNDKTYFLVYGGTYGMEAGYNYYFLYVIDEEGKIKIISPWECDVFWEGGEWRGCNLDYAIGYKQNLYFKVGNEIWEFNENDVLKNKFPANKIIIKDSEISFE